MLKYKDLNKFYEGSDVEYTTPLTSEYLNSIINQIQINFSDIDTRLSEIESVIVNKVIRVDEAFIKNANIDVLAATNSNIQSLLSDNNITKNLEVTSAEILNEKVDTSVIKNGSIDNGIITQLQVDNAKINSLVLNELKISDNYIFESNYISFIGNEPEIRFNFNEGTNGIRYDSKADVEREARIELDIENKNFTIEFNSEEQSDKFQIKTNSEFEINAKNINTNANITPISDVDFGNKDNPINTITARQFYGSYFSYNADVAEYYETDEKYEAGTLLNVGIETEATIYDYKNKRPILGIVSDKPAYILNKSMDDGVLVALKGRVPCKISNKGQRGDYIIPDFENKGYCLSVKDPKKFPIIGILIDAEKNIVKV